MQSCFIRHTQILGVSDDDVRRLWTDDQIAIHSGTDSESLDPNTYASRGEKIALRRFVLFAKEGAGAYDQLESIVKGTQLDHAWKHLSTGQQELVCSEFLRWHNREDLPRLKWLSLPTGRTYSSRQ
jgi:hypothetical protein